MYDSRDVRASLRGVCVSAAASPAAFFSQSLLDRTGTTVAPFNLALLASQTGGAMSYQSCASDRGYCIEVTVTACKSLSFHGMGRRYRVGWSILPSDTIDPALVTFPEQAEFLHEAEALRFGESRAHTFIDCAIYDRSKSSSAA
jgi:hypothetical protein